MRTIHDKKVENKQDFLLPAHSTKRSVGQISINHITKSGMKIQSIPSLFIHDIKNMETGLF